MTNQRLRLARWYRKRHCLAEQPSGWRPACKSKCYLRVHRLLGIAALTMGYSWFDTATSRPDNRFQRFATVCARCIRSRGPQTGPVEAVYLALCALEKLQAILKPSHTELCAVSFLALVREWFPRTDHVDPSPGGVRRDHAAAGD